MLYNHTFIIYLFHQNYNRNHIMFYILGVLHHTFIRLEKEKLALRRVAWTFAQKVKAAPFDDCWKRDNQR